MQPCNRQGIRKNRLLYNTFNKKEVEAYLCPNQFAYRTGGSCINAQTNDAYRAVHSRTRPCITIHSLRQPFIAVHSPTQPYRTPTEPLQSPTESYIARHSHAQPYIILYRTLHSPTLPNSSFFFSFFFFLKQYLRENLEFLLFIITVSTSLSYQRTYRDLLQFYPPPSQQGNQLPRVTSTFSERYCPIYPSYTQT